MLPQCLFDSERIGCRSTFYSLGFASCAGCFALEEAAGLENLDRAIRRNLLASFWAIANKVGGKEFVNSL